MMKYINKRRCYSKKRVNGGESMNAGLNRLELRHLRLVRALSLSGGMSAAAKQLHLTQSALSHQLKVLEESLGCELFIRHGKKLIMSAAGRRVLKTADAVSQELSEMKDDLNQIDQGKSVTLRIATECYTSFHWLPKVIPLFKQQYPDIHVELQPQAVNQISERLETGEIDVAIKMVPAKAPLKNHVLFKDQLVVVMSENHPLSKKKTISPEDLAKENLLLCPAAKEKLFMALAQYMDTQNIQTTEFPLTEAIIEWCHAGMGISVLADWAAKGWGREGVVTRPFDVSWAQRVWSAVTLPQELQQYFKDLITLIEKNTPISPRA